MSAHEIAEIIADLESGFDGDPWHGPALRAVLDGVSEEVAFSRPIPGGHSIGEIVVHLSAWDDVVVRRIEEGRAIEEPVGGSFPPIGEKGPEAWERALDELRTQHDRLIRVASGLDPARLDAVVAGKEYSVAHMLRGVSQHMAYHAGQIALLTKLAGR